MLKPDKILPIFFLIIFTALLFLPNLAAAGIEDVEPPDIKIHIGDFEGWAPGQGLTEAGKNLEISWLSEYISVIYRYGVGLAAVLAVVMIMVGGFIWLTSAGSPDKVGKAKEFITGALSGLFLALFSFVILYTVNPQLVALKPLVVQVPEAVEIESYRDVGKSTQTFLEDYEVAINPECPVSAETCPGVSRNEIQNEESLRDSLGREIGSKWDLYATEEFEAEFREHGYRMQDEIPFMPESSECSSGRECYYYDGIYYIWNDEGYWNVLRLRG